MKIFTSAAPAAETGRGPVVKWQDLAATKATPGNFFDFNDVQPLQEPEEPAVAAEPLAADRGQMAAFIDALFRYADQGTSVSLRSFYDDSKEDGLFAKDDVMLSGDLSTVTARAVALADRCAMAVRPVVFCPPVATFKTPPVGGREQLGERTDADRRMRCAL